MVIGFETDQEADRVEEQLSALENARGRDAGDRSGSRTLDLDLLLFGERVDAARRLPREDVLRYPFVLAPLAELAPARKHPVTGIPIAQAWAHEESDDVRLTLIGRLDAA
jgi:2-amino-4-hydroxy-6-hydroxymethyldihydropteridine diphosphokinase